MALPEPEAYRFRRDEADLSDHPAIARLVERLRPAVCIHCAWYAVPGAYWQSLENLVAR